MVSDTTEHRKISVSYWRPREDRLSERSLYEDDVWIFDGRTLGQNHYKQNIVDWRIFGDSARLLTDTRWKNLLEELKCFMWTLHFDRREGSRIQEGTTQRISAAFHDLVPWMMERGYDSLSKISNQASWDYLNWFRENHDKSSRDGKFQRKTTYATAWQALHILTLVFEQSSSMEERGYSPIPAAPYDGRRAYDLTVRELGYVKGEKIAPLPDELSVPTLREAAKWVAERSDDIVRLHRAWIEDVMSQGYRQMCKRAAVHLAESFTFSIDHATNQPWTSIGRDIQRIDSGGATRTLGLMAQPQRLVRDLIAACMIIIQGMTGMRSSDLASIQTSIEADEYLPPCLETRLSPDGLTEMFLLKGVEQKRSHEAHSWVLGGRPDQTDDYPLPVKAVLTLNRLLAPYRKVSGITSLIVMFNQSKSMALVAGHVGTLTSQWMNNAQRDFITNHVNLLTTTHRRNGKKTGFGFRSAQWRVTFALFVIRTNKRALGPLAKHFNHVDALMTEHGYIGNDPELLLLVDDARVSLATNTLYQLISEERSFAGGLESHMRSACSDLHAQLRATSREAGIEIVRGLVVEHDLRLHFTDYGACGVAVTPAVARCHQLAGSESPQHVIPNFGTRRPGVCAACRNFLISTDHLEYWRSRVTQLEAFKNENEPELSWRLGRELALARQFVRTLEDGRRYGDVE